MANFALYQYADQENAYKFFGVIIHDESEAIANTTGHPTIIFKDNEPWKYFDGFGGSFSITPD